MASAALQHLEGLLSARRLDRTLASPGMADRPVLSSGDPVVDDALGGGWPLGAISCLSGPRASGRTAVLWSSLAHATAAGHVVALVDTFDRLDTRAAHEQGLDLERVLWIRGAAITPELARPAMLGQAVRQAIRAYDLVLRAGGFACVALDLADVPIRTLHDLPMATWVRLAQVNEGRPTAALVVAETSVGRSPRGVSLPLASAPVWTGDSLQSRRFEGFDLRAVARG